MEPKTPSIAELIDALPVEAAQAIESAPAREELLSLFEELSTRPIPTGRLTRIWSLGTLQAKVAVAYLNWWLRSGFQSPETREERLSETHMSAALQVLGRMSYLRGAVMKLGQVLAHWPEVLPGSFASVLGRMYTEAPPMHFALLREHARRELGADPTEVFDDFETTAFAAASLGQVHRARIKGTDRQVAVKIQYPDIARTIQDDLRNLKTAYFGMRLSRDWTNLLEQFEGIRTMLEIETDYEQEAENLRFARHTLADLEDVIVPEVIPELSTGRILTMEYLDGHLLDPFMASNPPQELRDRHGAQLTRAIQRLWYRGRMVYADPHPGNFLFLEDGRLGLIDLGCCHRFTDEEFAYVMDVERASESADERDLLEALALGCDMPPEDMSDERFALMREYCDWVWEPLQTDEPFDYTDPAQFLRGARLYGEFVKRHWVRSKPVNVWLTKVFFGVRAMLTHLKARVPYGKILREESIL